MSATACRLRSNIARLSTNVGYHGGDTLVPPYRSTSNATSGKRLAQANAGQ